METAARAATPAFAAADEDAAETRPVPIAAPSSAGNPVTPPSAIAALIAAAPLVPSPPVPTAVVPVVADDAIGETLAPRSASPAISTAGDTALGAALMPLPAKGNVVAARFLLSIVIFPDASALDVGRNETCSTARSFGASDIPGDTFEKAKPEPITVTPEIVTGASPVFTTAIFFVLIEFSSCEPKFKDDGESCNAANISFPVPVTVYDCMASALLRISRSAEVFPAAVGSKIILKSMPSEGATETGRDGPAI